MIRRPPRSTLSPHPATFTTSLSAIGGERRRPNTTIGASAVDNRPECGSTPPSTSSNNKSIQGLSTRHLRWLQPRGSTSVLIAVPNHFQLIPATVCNRHCQSLLCDQLPEEDGTGMVQTGYIGR